MTNVLDWRVYILECGDRTLYTGISNNLGQRIAQHQSGKGAKYTRSHLPVKLVYAEVATSRSAAQQREAQIKKMNRPEKLKLIDVYDP
jgi:putative endonuclease